MVSPDRWHLRGLVESGRSQLIARCKLGELYFVSEVGMAVLLSKMVEAPGWAP